MNNVTNFGRNNAFHNYLDEFLAAIRIFGFLEKPVFHELSRHLQTRRLIAGETISLDANDKEGFVCVVDGNVQVFAKSKTSGNLSSENPYNGYLLLNEVATGGTVSSLFTILKLFTEDVKLSWEGEHQSNDVPSSTNVTNSTSGKSEDGYGDMSDRDHMGSPRTTRPPHPFATAEANISSLDLSSAQSESDMTEHTLRHDGPPVDHSPTMHAALKSPSIRASLERTPMDRFHHQHQLPPRSETNGRTRAGSKSRSYPQPPPQRPERPQVIARATVDTTLAVIPSDAFVRLRHKFPKATGQIVAVILTRFARVTLTTAHQYLGLTKEILQAENQLNRLLSYPLPAAFYEQGGMRNLRERFQPELKPSPPISTTRGPPNSDKRSMYSDQSDYFGSAGTSPKTVKAPSLPPTTPGAAATLDMASRRTTPRAETRGSAPLKPSMTRKDTFSQRRATNRKQVAAGDLLSMTTVRRDEEETYYRPTGFGRTETWSMKTPGSGARASPVNSLAHRKDCKQYHEPTAESLHNEFDLKEAVMISIAESIGLIQVANSDGVNPSGADSAALSTPNSPSLFGHRHAARGPAKSPFGGLSMLDISRSNSSSYGGLVGEEEVGSNQGTAQDSHFGAVEDLENDVQILYYKAGSVLVKEGEANAGLFFVIDGFLDITTTSTSETDSDFRKRASGDGEQEFLFEVKPGGIAGYLASLGSSESYTTIRAKTDCYVGLLPHKSFEALLERRPIVLLTLAKRLTSVLSPLVHHLDLALDWTHANAGQVLYREGDKSDSFYFVINGRLRSLTEQPNGDVKIVGEHGQNTIIGELTAITGSKRSHTVHAIRESELVRMPMALFNAIAIQHPATTIRFLRLIASRVRMASEPHQSQIAESAANTTSTNSNLNTVCIIPTTKNVPIAAFAERLKVALEAIGAPTAYLDQATAIRHLGRHAFSKMGKLKVSGWLGEEERKYRMVLYVVDTPVVSSWTTTCIKQADFVLVVGMGDDPSLGEYEKLLLASGTTARKEMVLLHPDRYVAPGSTRLWLKERPFITAHHHVELPGIVLPNKGIPVDHDPAAVAAFKHLREKVETRIKKYRFRPSEAPRRLPHLNDFARLARRLCGKSIGLVLGGGGGRGISHVGMIQAMEEMQIPVDAIGGCSIGALVGGLYAREGDLISTTGRTKQFSGRMSSMWRILSDLTYPFASYTTGHEFNRGIYKAFYDLHIEDMWIPYFCNSTNITHSRLEIHRTGYAWRYIRASMTLAGLLPPLSDRGSLLVDGGYFSNLPVTEMISELGAVNIVAVDVGSIDDTSPRHYGDSVSGWAVLLSR